MVCYGCGHVIDQNIDICPYCGLKFIYKVNKKNKKREINLFFKIFIVSFLLILFCLIFLIKYIVDRNSEINLEKKEEFVNKYCDGSSYIHGVNVSDFIDNYDCSKYASYMLDTEGNELSYHHFEYLISLKDINVYKIYTDITGKYISSVYSGDIMDKVYYDFLYDRNALEQVDSLVYAKIIYDSYQEDDFELFKSVLRNFYDGDMWDNYNYKIDLLFKYNNNDIDEISKSDLDYALEHKHFPDYIHKLRILFGSHIDKEDIDDVKSVALNKEKYVVEFQKYSNGYYFVSIFNENLMNMIPDDKITSTSMFEEIKENSYIINLDDLKKYRSWGGKFYNKNEDDDWDIINSYLASMLYSHEKYSSRDIDKFKYILDESKKDGFEVNYSDTMDLFLRKFKYNTLEAFVNGDNYTVDDHRYKIRMFYRMLVREGFKCYTECDFVQSEEKYGLRYL